MNIVILIAESHSSSKMISSMEIGLYSSYSRLSTFFSTARPPWNLPIKVTVLAPSATRAPPQHWEGKFGTLSDTNGLLWAGFRSTNLQGCTSCRGRRGPLKLGGPSGENIFFGITYKYKIIIIMCKVSGSEHLDAWLMMSASSKSIESERLTVDRLQGFCFWILTLRLLDSKLQWISAHGQCTTVYYGWGGGLRWSALPLWDDDLGAEFADSRWLSPYGFEGGALRAGVITRAFPCGGGKLLGAGLARESNSIRRECLIISCETAASCLLCTQNRHNEIFNYQFSVSRCIIQPPASSRCNFHVFWPQINPVTRAVLVLWTARVLKLHHWCCE